MQWGRSCSRTSIRRTIRPRNPRRVRERANSCHHDRPAYQSRGNAHMTTRTEQLASRLEQGANALAEFAGRLSDAQWRIPLPGDGRPVGVVVHHVASVYPIELDLARTVASGKPIVGITYEDAIKKMNAAHAAENMKTPKKDTLELLR